MRTREYLLKFVCNDCDGKFIVNQKDVGDGVSCPFCWSKYVEAMVG